MHPRPVPRDRQDLAPRQSAHRGVGQRHGRIEVCAGDRAEYEDEHGEPRASGKRVGQEGDSVVPAHQALAHDAGAHHGGEEQRGT